MPYEPCNQHNYINFKRNFLKITILKFKIDTLPLFDVIQQYNFANG